MSRPHIAAGGHLVSIAIWLSATDFISKYSKGGGSFSHHAWLNINHVWSGPFRTPFFHFVENIMWGFRILRLCIMPHTCKSWSYRKIIPMDGWTKKPYADFFLNGPEHELTILDYDVIPILIVDFSLFFRPFRLGTLLAYCFVPLHIFHFVDIPSFWRGFSVMRANTFDKVMKVSKWTLPR